MHHGVQMETEDWRKGETDEFLVWCEWPRPEFVMWDRERRCWLWWGFYVHKMREPEGEWTLNSMNDVVTFEVM